MYILGTFVLSGYMFSAPAQLNTAVKVQIGDYDPQAKSATVRTYMDEEYTVPGANYSMYWGMYLSGRNPQRWTPTDVADRDEIKQTFSNRINETLRTAYFGGLSSGGGCSFAGGEQLGAHVSGEDRDTMTFDVLNPGPFRVNCETLQRIVSAEGELARSLQSIEYPRLPRQVIGQNMRYLKMYEVAKAIATDDRFQEMVENSVSKSSNYAYAERGGEVGNCDGAASFNDCQYTSSRQLEYPSFDSVHGRLTNEQEDVLLDDAGFRSELQSVAETVYADYRDDNSGYYQGLEVDIEVKEVEYRVPSVTRVQQNWKILDCQQSCFNENCEGPNSCSSPCDCTVSCDPAEPTPCPETVCSTTDYGASVPTRGGDIWTEDPWSAAIDESGSYDDPLPTDIDFSWGDGSLRFTAGSGAFLRPVHQVRRGAPRTRFVQSDCGDSCSRSCTSSSADNIVIQNTRRVWELDRVESFVRVTINVTDPENRIPVRAGFRHPEFILNYDQISVETFS